MTDMRAVAKMMRELEDQLVLCMRCGMCQSVCPLYEQTGREADVARGKLALLDGLMNEIFADSKGTYERLNKCLLCGSCAANCPSGVSAMEIFLKARAILTGYMGLPKPKRIILRGMLSRPEIFDRVAEWGVSFQKIFSKPASKVIGTSCGRIDNPLTAGRHFKPLARKPLHREIPSMDTRDQKTTLNAGFFIGCLIDKIFPEVGYATIKALKHHEVGVFIPPGQGCCGIPALSSGDLPSFEKLLIHNLSLYEKEDLDVLLTACATCTMTIREIWPKFAPSLSEKRLGILKNLCEKTMDVSEFLVKRAGVEAAQKTREEAVPVTYHDPCHLKKSLGIHKEPRIIIKSSQVYSLKEMSQPDKCCGMGGSFNLQYYEISRKIGKSKRDDIARTGAKIVATGCPACMSQISDMLSSAGLKIAVKHPIELYAESLGDSLGRSSKERDSS